MVYSLLGVATAEAIKVLMLSPGLYMYLLLLYCITELSLFFGCDGIFGFFLRIENVYGVLEIYISAHHFILHPFTNKSYTSMNRFLI